MPPRAAPKALQIAEALMVLLGAQADPPGEGVGDTSSVKYSVKRADARHR